MRGAVINSAPPVSVLCAGKGEGGRQRTNRGESEVTEGKRERESARGKMPSKKKKKEPANVGCQVREREGLYFGSLRHHIKALPRGTL
jgi:hypothetical protein